MPGPAWGQDYFERAKLPGALYWMDRYGRITSERTEGARPVLVLPLSMEEVEAMQREREEGPCAR